MLESSEERIAALREFYPRIQEGDWRIEVAGQRVQIIKKDSVHGGVLEFGTELVVASDGSLAALLGASPGASTAAFIILQIIEHTFPQQVKTGAWSAKLKDMIPSYGRSLIENPALVRRVRADTAGVLRINDIKEIGR